MKSTKIIINNEVSDILTDAEALYKVYNVIKEGLVSETKKGKQYCFVTKYSDGYTVISDKTKTGYSFKIIKE